MRAFYPPTLLSLVLLLSSHVSADPALERAASSPKNVEMASVEPNLMPADTITLIENSSLWDKIRSSATLDFDPDHPRIIEERKRYLGSPGYLTMVTQRAEPFLFHIVDALEQEGLPLELALLPIIESAYIANAKSKSGAAGLWQFIPTTGQIYGLNRTRWYDGRKDVRTSTRAAIQYLKKLHKMFDGDWLLVLAAYNSGENNILAAMDQNLDQGEPLDYWHLKLREETTRYVPRFLAVLSIINSPDYYDIDLWPIEITPFFTAIDAGKRTHLKGLARKLDVDPHLLNRLNAGLHRKITPPGRKYDVLVPLVAAAEFHSIDSTQWNTTAASGTTHRVTHGETLTQIGRQYDVSVTHLKKNNQLRNDHIRAGQTLIIPGL